MIFEHGKTWNKVWLSKAFLGTMLTFFCHNIQVHNRTWTTNHLTFFPYNIFTPIKIFLVSSQNSRLNLNKLNLWVLSIWHTRPLARQLTLIIDHTFSHEINNHHLLLFQHQITLHSIHEIVVCKYFSWFIVWSSYQVIQIHVVLNQFYMSWPKKKNYRTNLKHDVLLWKCVRVFY
jgi:hypothetical protein